MSSFLVHEADFFAVPLCHTCTRRSPAMCSLSSHMRYALACMVTSTAWPLLKQLAALFSHAVWSQACVVVLCRAAPFSPDNISQAPLLLRLLHSLDEQASVLQPVSMDLVVAVLLAPILLQAMTLHKDELQAVLLGAPPHTFLRRKRKTVQASSRLATTAQARADSAAIVDDALQRWQERMLSHKHPPRGVQLREMLSCLTFAAMEVVRSKVALGVLPRANTSAAQHMLVAFWHTVCKTSKVGYSCFANCLA